MATTEKTLRMTFSLDNSRTKTLVLPDPRDDLQSADVSTFMESTVNKDALLVGTARLAGAKSALIRTVTDDVLF